MNKSILGFVAGILIATVGFPYAYQQYHGPNGKTSDTAVLVNTDGSPIDSSTPLAMKMGDSPSVDAAGRSRTSEPFGIFDDKRVSNGGDGLWEFVSSGVATSAVYNYNESSETITVGTGNNDYAYRQSRYFSYVPGKSQYIKLTFIMGTGVSNVAKRAGYFTDEDGVFFQQLGTVNSMCLRTSTSGSPVDSCVPQTSWNLDKMDGSCTLQPVSRCVGTSNPSGLNLDTTKTQLLMMDFLWQGVGRIRYGFQVNGHPYYVHEVNTANIAALPYMRTPSLPVRYEIRNIGTSAGGSLKQICTSVESEGGYSLPGLEFAISNGIAKRAITTRAPVLAIRLASTFNGKPNRHIARILHSGYIASTNDTYCEVVHVHFPDSTTGTWQAVSPDSAIEYSTDISAVSAVRTHVIDTNFVAAGQGSSSSLAGQDLDWVNYHGFIANNAAATNSQAFVVYCTAFAGTTNVAAELNWVESE